MRLVGISPEEGRGRVYKPVGCSACNNSGYKGRRAIFEMMVMNSEIREMAFAMKPIAQIRRAALQAGMRPLVSDGKIKVLKGLTTPKEVASSAQIDDFIDKAQAG
jgi:type IV pilus assembly protein PilB